MRGACLGQPLSCVFAHARGKSFPGDAAGLYAQRFNRLHRRDGALFRGRYKAIVVDKDNYLAQVVRYIHLNPVEARLVREPESYAWSSHRFYLRRSEGPEWLRIDDVMGEFSSIAQFH